MSTSFFYKKDVHPLPFGISVFFCINFEKEGGCRIFLSHKTGTKCTVYFAIKVNSLESDEKMVVQAELKKPIIISYFSGTF